MKLACLFSGGKDSTYAAYLAGKQGHQIAVLISMVSDNPDSYMYHTPSISQTRKQADRMGVPLLEKRTPGEKEEELEELESAISEAREAYGIEGVVTGALASEYQASRIRAICDRQGLECVNPLWGMDQLELLRSLVRDGFRVIITAVAAEPLDSSWLGREIDEGFIEEARSLQERHGINPAGEGGEFETLVLDCPLFSRPLKVKSRRVLSEGGSHRMEAELE